MKKIIKPFTDEETEVLKGNYSKLARKHKVSPNYVGKIAEGKRAVKSLKSKAIMKDLKKITTALMQLQ